MSVHRAHCRRPEMTRWRSASKEDAERLLEEGVSELCPRHRALFDSIRVTPRPVPMASDPGGFVYVVAERKGRLLYWSGIEEGWESAQPDAEGGISERGCNQFELSHVMYQMFGDSAMGRCSVLQPIPGASPRDGAFYA
jgi:hypothetical protein